MTSDLKVSTKIPTKTNIVDRSDAREIPQQLQAELQRLIEQTPYVAALAAVNPRRLSTKALPET